MIFPNRRFEIYEDAGLEPDVHATGPQDAQPVLECTTHEKRNRCVIREQSACGCVQSLTSFHRAPGADSFYRFGHQFITLLNEDARSQLVTVTLSCGEETRHYMNPGDWDFSMKLLECVMELHRGEFEGCWGTVPPKITGSSETLHRRAPQVAQNQDDHRKFDPFVSLSGDGLSGKRLSTASESLETVANSPWSRNLTLPPFSHAGRCLALHQKHIVLEGQRIMEGHGWYDSVTDFWKELSKLGEEQQDSGVRLWCEYQIDQIEEENDEEDEDYCVGDQPFVGRCRHAGKKSNALVTGLFFFLSVC
ncbi:hypothetical protein T439DRAFT_332617 [Meredithblackwellia eburnea MCA 4105]